MTKGKYRNFIFTGLLLMVGIGLVWFFQHRDNDKDRIFVEVKPFQTAMGWGYDIVAEGKTYIHQEFIPALAGKHSFKSREDAIMVGKIVIEKMNSKGLPTISIEELRTAGIVQDSLSTR